MRRTAVITALISALALLAGFPRPRAVGQPPRRPLRRSSAPDGDARFVPAGSGWARRCDSVRAQMEDD